jgi:Ca-activated chloride channel family protein
MLELQWPWLLWLLPLPLLVTLLPRQEQREAALRVPFYQNARELQQQSTHTSKRPFTLLGLWLIWICILLAATNPRWLGEPVSFPTSGRDLLLAVDVSGSMKIEDMQYQGQTIDRLQAIKIVIGDFVKRRTSDRLGLVLFGSQAYLYAPLTYDRETVHQLLQETQIGFAGEQTAIGDGIGLSVKRLRNRPETNRVLILLTDGANNSGEITPLRAAQLAQQENITIYTIGFGADEMIVPGVFGARRINPSQDLDEETMISVAEMTGGKYFRARNLEELENIHRELDLLEPVEHEEEVFRPLKTLFHWPLALAFILSLLLASSLCWRNRVSSVKTPQNGAPARGTAP